MIEQFDRLSYNILNYDVIDKKACGGDIVGEWIKDILGYCVRYALRVIIGLVVLTAFLFGLNHFGLL